MSGRDRSYRLRDTESHTLATVGIFHLVFDRDLREGRYGGDAARLDEDIKALCGQGLLQSRTITSDHEGHAMRVLALTEAGRDLLERHRGVAAGRPGEREQRVHAGFRKHADLIHDASLYRMYQVEAAAIEARGGTIQRVVLDDELKEDVFTRAHVDTRLSEEVGHQQLLAAARDCHLPVVHDHLEFPDVRVEYEMPGDRGGRVDLELVTAAYRGAVIAAKAAAGFTLYSAAGSASRGIHSLGGSSGGRGTAPSERYLSSLLSL